MAQWDALQHALQQHCPCIWHRRESRRRPCSQGSCTTVSICLLEMMVMQGVDVQDALDLLHGCWLVSVL
jgi:hypothetical protein